MTRSRPVFARLFCWVSTCLMALGLGLAAAPAALVRLLAGENTGKALVRVGAPA